MSEKKSLTRFDATMVVAGSMIGSAIFIVAADMGRTVGGPGWMMLLWLVAGVMTIFAALSYGELAGMFPNAGGQYIYLKEAYGRLVAFLYGWTLFAVIQTGTIAAVGVAFAKYMGVLFPVFSENHILYNIGNFKVTAAQLLGIGSIFALTWINSRGIRYGQIIVRLFTSAKLIALLGIIVLGLLIFPNKEFLHNNMLHFWDHGVYGTDASGKLSFQPLTGIGLMAAFGVGMVGSLFSSDAWNNVTFIAGEIKEPKKNIPLSLLYGTVLVIGLYLLVNFAFLNLLPFFGHPDAVSIVGKGVIFAEKDRVATAAVSQIFGGTAVNIMAILIIISAIGCNNGLILSSVRVYQTMANDGLFFKNVKKNNKYGEPASALWVQFVWASVLCLSGKYGDLLDYVIFAVVLFYILTILGIFILRKKRPLAERPYKAFGYPIIPALYIVLAVLFCLNILIMKPSFTFPGLIIVAIGVPVFYYWDRTSRSENSDKDINSPLTK